MLQCCCNLDNKVCDQISDFWPHTLLSVDLTQKRSLCDSSFVIIPTGQKSLMRWPTWKSWPLWARSPRSSWACCEFAFFKCRIGMWGMVTSSLANFIFHFLNFPVYRWESSSQSLRLHLLQLKSLNRSIVRDGHKVWVLPSSSGEAAVDDWRLVIISVFTSYHCCAHVQVCEGALDSTGRQQDLCVLLLHGIGTTVPDEFQWRLLHSCPRKGPGSVCSAAVHLLAGTPGSGGATGGSEVLTSFTDYSTETVSPLLMEVEGQSRTDFILLSYYTADVLVL